MAIARAIRHRNFRLFLAGQGVSVMGTWLTRFATSWMAYRLTGSELVLGLVTFCNHAPTSLLAPFAGVLVDRWNLRRTVVITQVFALLQSAALAAFALTGTMTVGHLIMLGLAQGAINAFDMPARQSFLRQMIDDPGDLPNAIALNSSIVNLAKLLGPVAAAVLVAAVGEGLCYAIDAASYLAVLGSLALMRLAPQPIRRHPGNVGAQLRDGLAYVWQHPVVRPALLMLAASSVLGGAYASLMPAVAADALGGGPHTLGILLGASGLGALLGALYLASRASPAGLDAMIARSSLLLGVALVALELAVTVWLAAPVMFAVGLGVMLTMASTNTVTQTVVDPEKLGRVMSLYAVALAGGVPIGAFCEGLLASHIGAVHTFAVAGVLCFGSGLLYRRSLQRRREREAANVTRS